MWRKIDRPMHQMDEMRWIDEWMDVRETGDR
jgi:hypothetical protein